MVKCPKESVQTPLCPREVIEPPAWGVFFELEDLDDLWTLALSYFEKRGILSEVWVAERGGLGRLLHGVVAAK